MSGKKLVDTGCHLARGPENRKTQTIWNSWRLLSTLRCIFPAASCSFFQVWTQAAACSRPLKPLNETSIFFRERVIFFVRRVMCFSSHAAVCFSTESQQSTQAYSPELIDRSLSFYALTIPNGLNVHARSTSGFISLNMPFSKSTVIYISARNCFKISTGDWEWR